MSSAAAALFVRQSILIDLFVVDSFGELHDLGNSFPKFFSSG